MSTELLKLHAALCAELEDIIRDSLMCCDNIELIISKMKENEHERK